MTPPKPLFKPVDAHPQSEACMEGFCLKCREEEKKLQTPPKHTAHTPGDWRWEWSDCAWYLRGPGGETVLSDGSAGGEYPPDIDVNGPDAKLIAAAPDLLEFAKKVVAWAHEHPLDIQLQAVRGMAEAAIHKAEEGQ